MPALGVPASIPRDVPLTRFQFYLGLADALANKQHKESTHLKELADSFGHDVLNLAALAGRLLWCEGVTPEVWRSHDLIGVSVDVESYYVMLQCACDIMADCIATLGCKKGRGQVPSESFHRLTQWAARNSGRLLPEYGNLLSGDLGWFRQINTRRTDVVHRGKKLIIYTDRVSFNWGKLLPSLAEITEGLLKFSEELGAIVLCEDERKNFAERTVIDGVYVPAIYHLLHKYKTPEDCDDLNLSAQVLLSCGGYVEAGFIGYPDGFWWNTLLGVSRVLHAGPYVADIPINPRGQVHDNKFVFSRNGVRYGLIACEEGNSGTDWLTGAAKSAASFSKSQGVNYPILLLRTFHGSAPTNLPETEIPLIVEGSSDAAVQRVAEIITRGNS